MAVQRIHILSVIVGTLLCFIFLASYLHVEFTDLDEAAESARQRWSKTSTNGGHSSAPATGSKGNQICNPHEHPGDLYIDPGFRTIEGALKTEWKSLKSNCNDQRFIQTLAWGDNSTLPASLLGRTVVLIGDSIDRNNIQFTCEMLNGTYKHILPDTEYWPQASITLKEQSEAERQEGPYGEWRPNEFSPRSFPTTCYIEKIDLMLVNVFHFGLDSELYFDWKDQVGPPYLAEDRVLDIAVPLLEKMKRKIDIVSFSSGLWDLARFGRIDDSLLGPNDTTSLVPLSFDRLEWYLSRYSLLLDSIHTSFSNTKHVPLFLARIMHLPPADDASSFQQWWQPGGTPNGRHVYYFPTPRINQLNQAAQMAVEEQNGRWEIDDWGTKLYGENRIYDIGNVHPYHAAS